MIKTQAKNKQITNPLEVQKCGNCFKERNLRSSNKHANAFDIIIGKVKNLQPNIIVTSGYFVFQSFGSSYHRLVFVFEVDPSGPLYSPPPV